ncbi:MAG: hypothetical protein FWD80_02980 [Propionibacteriaceae bacterium]|nr:hypothetical protein [Propionibacteriaceae bacterium]
MKREPFSIDLAGLQVAPAQTWGAVRMVPLLRDEPVHDLRLHPRLYGTDSLSIVEVGRNQRPGRTAPGEAYVAFVPHALVARWTVDGAPVATVGTQMLRPDQTPSDGFEVRVRRRLVRREQPNQARLLPLHLAVDGYLSLGFHGPATRWPEWSRRTLSEGLSERSEWFSSDGEWGLEDALRVFEIHPRQCGVVLYCGDQLVAAFVVPHPDDYRALHPTLINNMFAAEIQHFARMYPNVEGMVARFDESAVHDLADLRSALDVATQSWREMHTIMAAGLFDAPMMGEQAYRMGRFTLTRFLPVFDPDAENHIGEAIVDDAGNLAYLATVRLSVAQAKRGHLLAALADNDWNLDETAAYLRTDRRDLILRLDRAGFGDLLRPDLVEPARRSVGIPAK